MSDIDVCQLAFSAAENLIEDDAAEFNELLEWLKDRIDSATFDRIESICNCRVAAAQLAAFRAGWILRGRV